MTDRATTQSGTHLRAEPPGAAAPAMPAGWHVPDFKPDLFKGRSTRYACVIPVINEGERLLRQLAEMQAQGHMERCDVILADGGSRDGSTEPGRLARLGLRALLTKTGPGKLSAQLRVAYAWALMERYEGIITIDGNGKDGVEGLPLFIDALDRGVDYAQASRFIKGGIAENTPFVRTLAIRLIHAPVCSLAARHWLTDTTQGFRAYSRRYLEDPRVQPFREVFTAYELLAYMTVRASRLGYRVEEIPTRRSYPLDEPPPTKISFFRGNYNLIRTLLAAATGRYAPDR